MYKSGDVSQFKELSQFDSLQEFNNSIEQYLLDNPFTKAETVAFKRLVRYSAKYPGVCYAKIQTIVSATHKDTVGISRSSFERMLRKAKKLGIIVVHNTKKHGWKGHNVYVFQPYKTSIVDNSTTNEVEQNKNIDVSNKTSNLSKTKNLNNRKEGQNRHIFDHTFVSSNVPEKLVEAISPFFPKASDIYSIYKRLKMATREYPVSLYEDIEQYVSVFKQTLLRYKKGLVRGEYLGYLYGAFKKTCHDINNRYYMPSDSVYFDWLAN